MSTRSKTAIITGASSGIGLATARTFVANGFNVVMSGRDPARLEAARESLGAPESTLAVAGDVGRAEDRAALVVKTLERFGAIDVLVNNAGYFALTPFQEVTEEILDGFLTTNFKGTYFTAQAVVPHMQANGGGSIINVGSVLVDHAIGGAPASAPIAIKGAIHAMTVQLAAELSSDNIRINTVAPGIIRTNMHVSEGVDNTDTMAGLHLLGRVGESEEVAEAALYLASNAFTTGTILNVDGGHVAGHHVG